MKAANRKCIRLLNRKSMKATKTRNIIAVLAIALTAVLFTSLFTVAMSINKALQESNFRQAGGWCHGTFKYLTKEQFDELKTDPIIQQYGLRRFLGMPFNAPFDKSHVELGYSDANQAHWMYCDPVEGRLPEENTNEAATDTRVLELLGVEPVLGNEFTLTFDVDGTEVTQSFTLCGWWEHDEVTTASHVLVSHSLVQTIYNQVGIGSVIGNDEMTGAWNIDIMLDSPLHIERDMERILKNHDYQLADRSKNGYIAIGINWGYSGAQLSNNIDPMTVIAIAGLLLLIIFTGYLIIYNIFRISVSNDIRFYGLLKTIGTTGRQLRRLIRQQALWLSAIGIPIGLFIGYGIGRKLTPVILSRLNGVDLDAVSASPLIFFGSALFALITVIISCRRPGRMASRVSPVEAVRYTEAANSRKTIRKAQAGASLPKMAWANLNRSRSRTAVTVLSLSLAVVLLNLVFTFTNGFDMDKYLSNMASDFILADAGYFQVGSFNLWGKDKALPEDVIHEMEAGPGVIAGGRVYGKCSVVEEFVSEAYLRARFGRWNDEATLDNIVAFNEKREDLIADNVQLYGMERYAIDKLSVLDGDIAGLYEPGGRYVAAVYSEDDYGKPMMESHWAKLGDTVTLRYVTEYEYYNPDTGEILDVNDIKYNQPYRRRAKNYQDIDYEVAALVCVPNSLSYRYYGTDEFVMNDRTFIQDSGTNSVMYYACDIKDESTTDMEEFLSTLTKEQMPQFDYESKATYTEEFESFRSMFLILGGVLCFIVGLVGVLNFLNAVLTGILTRRCEFAMLQSIGMTGRQLRIMLIWEGMYYAFITVTVSLAFSVAAGPLLSKVLSSMFWFYTYHFTILPILCVAPVFALLGIVLPLTVYRVVARHSIIEQLRDMQ